MSVTITSGCSIRENSRSALPFSTSPTTSYLELSNFASVSIKTLWSSANNTRCRVVPSRVDMCPYTSRALRVAQCGVFRKHSEKLPATSRTCPDTGHTQLSLQCAHEAATKRASLGTRGNSESGRGRLHLWISPRSYGSDAPTAHRCAIPNSRSGAAESILTQQISSRPSHEGDSPAACGYPSIHSMAGRFLAAHHSEDSADGSVLSALHLQCMG